MRNWTLTISTLLLSGVVAAQAPVPGTFSNTQTTQQNSGSGNNGGYIVSPPMISYGDGITPTVITNQDAVTVTLPQNTSVNGATVQTNNPATPSDNATAASNGAQGNGQVAGMASRNFDFVKAPNGENSVFGGSIADDSVSLGEVARKVRNGKQIAKRTITNADVDALNSQYPGSNAGQSPDGMNGNAVAAPATQQNGSAMSGASVTPSGGGTAGAAQPQSSQPAYAQPSTQGPFGPRATPNDGTKPNPQQGQGISPRSSSRPVYAPQSNDTDQGTSGSETKQQLPRSSSSLPLLGTLGALSTLAGICYLKMR